MFICYIVMLLILKKLYQLHRYCGRTKNVSVTSLLLLHEGVAATRPKATGAAATEAAATGAANKGGIAATGSANKGGITATGTAATRRSSHGSGSHASIHRSSSRRSSSL